MTSTLRNFALLIFVTFLPFSSQALASEAPSVFAGQRVLHIGDSHVRGPFGRYVRAEIEARGGEYTSYAFVGKGVRFFIQDSDGLNRLLESNDYDIIIINLGGNDSSRARSRTYESQVRQLFQTCQAETSRVIWVGPPAYVGENEELRRFRNMIADAIMRVVGQSHFIDVRSMTNTSEGRAGDGIHFTRSGGRTWALRVIPLLENML